MANQFDKKIILDTITAYADEGETLENIKDYAFNSDPWIIGIWQASEALKDFDEESQLYEKTNLNGIFGAIQYVQDYENDEVGEVNTNLSDPEAVATMVAYINGEKIINKLAEVLNIDLDDELTEQQAEQLSSVETMEELLKK